MDLFQMHRQQCTTIFNNLSNLFVQPLETIVKTDYQIYDGVKSFDALIWFVTGGNQLEH